MKRKKSKLSDKVALPKGRLRIRIRDVKTKKITEELKFDNIIVNNFRTQTLHALAGNSLADRVLSKAQLGSNDTAAAVGDTVIDDVATPNGLGAPVDVTLTADISTSKTLQLDGTLGALDGNGRTFREVGLCFHNTAPNLAARQVRPPMTKAAGSEWEIQWLLEWP